MMLDYRKKRVVFLMAFIVLKSGVAWCGEVGEAKPKKGGRAEKMIDFTDAESVKARQPLLIAHRGGVVTPSAPECSEAAIRLAAEHGYDMVELDIQECASHDPVVFHDRNLSRATGVEGRVVDLSKDEVSKVRYRGDGEPILSLEEALSLCRELKLGVMLDFKAFETEEFLRRTVALLEESGLTRSSVTISGKAEVRKALANKVLLTVSSEQFGRVLKGEEVDLSGTFWFGLPKDLPDEVIPRLQKCGALVIPAINTFRYSRRNHLEEAARDSQHLLRMKVDGFQIDSVYQDQFGLPRVGKD